MCGLGQRSIGDFETVGLSVTTKSVLVVGGGRWQIPIIQEAHRIGLLVVSSGPSADSPAAAFADYHAVADARDWASNLEIARRYKVDAVVTDQTDAAVPTVATVAECVGLPGITISKALTFTNKYAMRAAVAAIGMAQPEFTLCRLVEDALGHTDRWGFPVVIKPVDGQSSRGVSVAHTRSEVLACFEAAYGASTSGLVLCERFLAGTEYTVEGFVSEGRHLVLAVSEKAHLNHNPFVAETLMFRRPTADRLRMRIADYVSRLIEALGLPFGLTHTEVIVVGDDIFLVETAARGGGTLLSSLIAPTLSGFNSGEAFLKQSLGNHVSIPFLEPTEDAIVLRFFSFPAGRVMAIEGVDEVDCLPGVLKSGLLFGAGDELMLPQDDSTRHMFVIARGESEDSAVAVARRAFERVSITYDES